jgi:hypothetical protein
VRDQENWVDGFGQKYLHSQSETGMGIVVQQERTVLCSKLWPHPGNELQQFSDNLNVERTVDCLSFGHKFFMNHTLFVKKCDQHGFEQTNLFGPW